MAGRDLGAFRPRYRHERGSARSRWPSYHPRRQLQGGGPAARGDRKLGAVVPAVPDRVAFVAALAARWARLRRTPAERRRVAIVMANYPNRDGRLANGVGLDTPAGVVRTLRALAEAGYGVTDLPADLAELMDRLSAGVTNDLRDLDQRIVSETLELDRYQSFFEGLPEAVRAAVTDRWGDPANDPFVRDGNFLLPAIRLGNAAIAIQPARGYQIDPSKTYHDPDLVPPHAYLAFYAWVRQVFDAHAVVHFGKHGNLEWLPGKSLAMSETCFPEVALGPLPHLYPFIVNDPGEGTQAKRRAAAVIIDHLTPPLTRAESYGPLRELEMLVDEYYEAAGVDPRRIVVLRDRILELSAATGLDVDCGVSRDDEPQAALAKLDNHLCELKELQIRDGLHVFGVAPEGGLLTDLLVALTRLPRGKGDGRDASLIRALAADLGLEFDPLDCVMGDPWIGARPAALETGGVWRSHGDTVERLEELAWKLVAERSLRTPEWLASYPVLDYIATHLRPVVSSCGDAELTGLLRGLDGRFVEPGPSGAPTRGRPEVLPTGRNFYRSIRERSPHRPRGILAGNRPRA